MIKAQLSEKWLWLLLGLCFLPWFIVQTNVSIPGDMAWLSLAAEKFLAGERMTASFHDNNPPLSYLIYSPVALLAHAGWPLWDAALAYGVSIALLFTALLALVARKGWGLKGGGYWALIIGYLLPLTFLFQGELGNKDYLIAAALPPFLLAQMVVTDKGRPVKWYIGLTLVLATPFVLLKPHYGLLPVCLLLHRFFKGRKFRVVYDPDFLCLAVGGVIYAAITFIWFHDYLTDVLWDVSIGLYAGTIMHDVFKTAALMISFSATLIVLAFFTDAAETDKKLVKFLALMTLAAVIPFATQMKGFSLHMIPYLALCCPAVLVLMMQYLAVNRVREIILIGGVLAAGYAYICVNNVTTHDDFRRSEFAAKIHEQATPVGGFVMQDRTTNVAIPLAVYMDIPHASRFSSLWFVSHLAARKDASLTAYYAGMMAEDLNRYKPEVVALYHDPAPQDDLLALFATNERFRQAWVPYRNAGVVPFDKNEFYKRPGLKVDSYPAYDLYIRE